MSNERSNDPITEIIAKTFADAEALLPNANAPVYLGMKSIKSWELRRKAAEEVVQALADKGYTISYSKGW